MSKPSYDWLIVDHGYTHHCYPVDEKGRYRGEPPICDNKGTTTVTEPDRVRFCLQCHKGLYRNE